MEKTETHVSTPLVIFHKIYASEWQTPPHQPYESAKKTPVKSAKV